MLLKAMPRTRRSRTWRRAWTSGSRAEVHSFVQLPQPSFGNMSAAECEKNERSKSGLSELNKNGKTHLQYPIIKNNIKVIAS